MLIPTQKAGFMYFKKDKNLLPKEFADRAALKTQSPQHRLLRSRGFKKPSILAKFSVLGLLWLYLLGYQPAFTIPPIKKAIARAEFSQEQIIEVDSFKQPFLLPHPGYISTRYSRWHPGIDIATGLSMPVRPIQDGEVREISYNFWGLGNHIVVDHGQEISSLYAHMGRVYVKKGDHVTPSSILGQVGLTGRTSGPHTHLEVTRGGHHINPENILPQLPNMPRLTLTKKELTEAVEAKAELKFDL